jgi:hypothetical protein
VGEMRNASTFLVEYLKGRDQLGDLRHRCEENIKTDIKGTGSKGMFFIEGKMVSCCEHGNGFLDSIKARELLDWLHYC